MQTELSPSQISEAVIVSLQSAHNELINARNSTVVKKQIQAAKTAQLQLEVLANEATEHAARIDGFIQRLSYRR